MVNSWNMGNMDAGSRKKIIQGRDHILGNYMPVFRNLNPVSENGEYSLLYCQNPSHPR